MKKLLLTATAVALMGTSAIAADLPAKSKAATVNAQADQFLRPYVQANVGTNLDGKYTVFGAKGGLETKYLRADVGYDYFSQRNLYSASVYAQTPVYSFTPFVGVGLGRAYDAKEKFEDVSLVSVGTRYNFTQNFAVELAGRQINGIDNKKLQETQILGGVVFKF